jgi:monofunctional glycosyltransferase
MSHPEDSPAPAALPRKSRWRHIHPGRIFWYLFFSGWLFAGFLGAVAFYTLYKIPFYETNALSHVRADAEAAVTRKLDGNTKNYKWVPLKQINKDVYHAIIASEDGRFYQHHGIDYDALWDAAQKNFERRTFSVGGSTITQQMVKNVYLSNDKNLIRKYREFLGTQRIEQVLTKKEILEVYLNIIEFGPNIYGIHHAARYYFGKTAADLTAREAAFLAILMPAPKKYFYSIYKNKKMNTRHNRKYQRILRDMMRQGYLTQAAYRSYANQTFYGAPPLDNTTVEKLDGLDEQLDDDNQENTPTEPNPVEINTTSVNEINTPSNITDVTAEPVITPGANDTNLTPTGDSDGQAIPLETNNNEDNNHAN